ncbi:hypothetical protein L7F22_058350 [Adiantum nelumboides]|nr:hypothetical protein [Adiantum nelumboides]
MDSPTMYSQERDSMDAELLLALEEAFLEAGINFPSSIFRNALFWTGDSDAFIGYRLKNWLTSMRRRLRTASLTLEAHQRPTLSDLSNIRLVSMDLGSIVDNIGYSSSKARELDSEDICLKERLKMSVEMDINSTSFTWGNLVSLHHSQQASSSGSEDDMSKPVEVTVNSGGVVFFATFKESLNSQLGVKEAVAVLKFTSSSLVTQSERLGNELAKHMGVYCPQSRLIYKGSDEWRELQTAAEKCSDAASSVGDEDNKATCSEFLEALNLSHCVLLMGYIKGCPFLESQNAFQMQAAAQTTAAGLARIFLLDLVLRNEDRLCCPQLGWRGNPANLLCAQESPLGHQFSGRFFSISEHTRTSLNNQEAVNLNERRFSSADSALSLQSCDSLLKKTDVLERPIQSATELGENTVFLVAIDSGVPRRPPAGKRAMDKVSYPKVIELILNCPDYAASLLYEISGGKLGFLSVEGIQNDVDQIKVVKAFQMGLKKGIRDMQNLYLFLLKLYRMLQILLLKFFQSINDMFPPEEEPMTDEPESETSISPKVQRPNQTVFLNQSQKNIEAELSSLQIEESFKKAEEHGREYPCSTDNALKRTPDKSPSQGSPRLSKQLTRKLKSVNRTAKVDARLNDELKRWNEILDAEGRRFCEDHGFVTGFLEGGRNHSIVRNYEFKVCVLFSCLFALQ